jgi:hypothetical protein
MNAITKAARINRAIQVIEHINNDMSVVEACQTVGMPRSSFYYIVNNNPEAFTEVQEIIDANNLEQLMLILQSKVEILNKVLEDGLSDKTKPRVRLAIYSKLSDLVDRYIEALRAETEISNNTAEFLKRGPHLKPGKSRLTASPTTATVMEDD